MGPSCPGAKVIPKRSPLFGVHAVLPDMCNVQVCWRGSPDDKKSLSSSSCIEVVDFNKPTIALDTHSTDIAANLDGHHQHTFVSALVAQSLRMSLMHCVNVCRMEPTMSMNKNVPQTFW